MDKICHNILVYGGKHTSINSLLIFSKYFLSISPYIAPIGVMVKTRLL